MKMTTAQAIRLSFIFILWIMLCWMLVSFTPVFTLRTLLTIIISGIVVFVPIFKKYKRNERHDTDK